MEGGLLRLKSFVFFFKSEFFFLEIIALYNFTGLGITKEDDVPQNDCEKNASTEPMAGNVIVCFLSWTKDKIICAAE